MFSLESYQYKSSLVFEFVLFGAGGMRWESLSSVCTGNRFVHFWYDSLDPSTKKELQPMLGPDSNSARIPTLSPSENMLMPYDRENFCNLLFYVSLYMFARARAKRCGCFCGLA